MQIGRHSATSAVLVVRRGTTCAGACMLDMSLVLSVFDFTHSNKGVRGGGACFTAFGNVIG